jgi:predicted O-linked N-acetylglucosamine transferase (SPINDLY family)
MLGTLVIQGGDAASALKWFAQAVEAAPAQALYHAHLGEAQRRVGNIDSAERNFRDAIRLGPDLIEAHDALAAMLKSRGQFEAAAAEYRETVRLRPDFSITHYNLGVVLTALGEIDEAVDCYRRACACQPQLAEAHLNLASLLHNRREINLAASEYQCALAIRPDYFEALENYGIMLQTVGRSDEALLCFEHALRVRPGSASAHFNRGNILKTVQRSTEAIAEYREAVRLEPSFGAAYHNLAVIYNEFQQADPALEYCEKGLALDPGSASLCECKAFALHLQGRGDQALVWYRKAMELDTARADLHSNFLYTLNYLPGFSQLAVFTEHRAWAERFAEPLTHLAAPHEHNRGATRKLRLGYVSAHFRRHAVNNFSEPILVAHDHDKFEIYCYSDVASPDAVTAKLEAAADVWRPVVGLSDEQLAEQIRNDRIDILVDLAGHIGGNRLLTFARKPAPIQVTYLGYQNTTGMTAMDYRVTDEQADPPDLTERYYTEKLVRLPRAFFCYRPPDEAPPVSPLPAASSGHVTFGSFNSFRKVTPPVIDAWLRILGAVERSRLLVLAGRGGYVEQHLRELARAYALDPARIVLHDRKATAEYLDLIAQADIALDPFPFTGHTTTCDSIWMGVPVVMLQGESYASRFGGSVLRNVGLTELITKSVEQYVGCAVALANDRTRLTRLRATLRGTMSASPLLDFPGFTRNLEAAYRQMWNDWLGV